MSTNNDEVLEKMKFYVYYLLAYINVINICIMRLLSADYVAETEKLTRK